MTQQAYPIKCRIRNADAGPTRVDVYDDIGEGGWFSEGLTAKSFASQLGTVKGPLDVHINSGGGDVFDGISIANSIKAHKGRVTTVVDGIAASIASVIAQAGQERVVQPGAMLMIHDAFGACLGNAAEMAKMASTLDQVSDNLAGIYADRAGSDAQDWRAAMREETWYTAEQAVASGLADRIGEGEAELPAGLDLEAFTSVPGRIAARLRTMPQARTPIIVDADGNHAPMSGSHAHSHPAYGSQGADTTHAHDHTHAGDANHHHSHADAGDGADGAQDHAGQISGEMEPGACCSMCGPDCACGGKPAAHAQAAAGMHGDHKRVDPDGDGDCDACPDGDTDHDYWTAAGEQIKSLPGKPVPADALTGDAVRDLVRQMLRDAADGVDNSPWDGPKAMANGAASDDPAAFYEGICAGQKSGDKTTQAAWALPYKYHPGDAPNAAGVKAALGRLPQTEGLTNASEAKTKLQGLMKKINPDYEPADREPIDISGTDLEQVRNALKGALA